MKSLLPLYECLLIDASKWCRVSTLRDLKTITERVNHEGVSFLTISLPSFCKGFEKALDRGYVASTDFLGFKKTGLLPSLLKGLTTLVFDQHSGSLLDVPDPIAIFFVRQVCLYSKKILLPCTEKRVEAALDRYVECELDVRKANLKLSKRDLVDFSRVARMLFGNVLAKCDSDIKLGLVVPRHGPGKTADKIVGNRKYEARTWTKRLEQNYLGAADFIIPNYGFNDNLVSVNFHEPGTEQPVEVVCVPKTLKTPRIIAMEPAHMQYVQQSILEKLVLYLESDRVLGGMVGFTDQTPNQKLAQAGSLDGSLATLDLSEASDRVSLRLVSRLLGPYPALLRAVMACRSQRANVPGWGVLHLAKFASMGSALCFPMEAMVFLTVVILGLERRLKRPLAFRDLKQVAKCVRVYGDDIVVPSTIALSTTRILETYGLKVNVDKSFWTGKFRESCGGEYYMGISVKPVKLTHVLPYSRQDAEEFIATVSHRNQLFEAGLWTTARYLDNVLERLAPFPVVGRDSSALGRWSFLPRVSEERWDPALQRWLVKAAVVHAKLPISRLDDSGALLKFFLKRGEEPIYLKDHLERSGRPWSVDTRLRWIASI